VEAGVNVAVIVAAPGVPGVKLEPETDITPELELAYVNEPEIPSTTVGSVTVNVGFPWTFVTSAQLKVGVTLVVGVTRETVPEVVAEITAAYPNPVGAPESEITKSIVLTPTTKWLAVESEVVTTAPLPPELDEPDMVYPFKVIDPELSTKYLIETLGEE